MAPVPNSPGGRLMLWIRSSSMRTPSGRASQFGEGSRRACATQPAASIANAASLGTLFQSETAHPISHLAKRDAQQLGGLRSVVAGARQSRRDRFALL